MKAKKKAKRRARRIPRCYNCAAYLTKREIKDGLTCCVDCFMD